MLYTFVILSKTFNNIYIEHLADNTVNASKLSTMTSTDSEDIEKISSISTQFDKSKFTNQSSSIDAFESDQSQRKASIAYDILSDDDENIRRDLLTTVVESLFNVLWYGINGTTEESWIVSYNITLS